LPDLPTQLRNFIFFQDLSIFVVLHIRCESMKKKKCHMNEQRAPRTGGAVRTVLFLMAAIIPLLFANQGCENSFTPRDEFNERLAVFCVLDPSVPHQIVRIETTYDAETTESGGQGRPVDSAAVRVDRLDRNQQTSWVFRDTLIDAGQGVLKKVWISTSFKPDEGGSYRLSVNVPGLPAVTAEVRVPSKPYIDLIPPVLSMGKNTVELVAGAISTVAPPKGFYFRLWVSGEKNVGGSKTSVRMEVPVRIDRLTNDTIFSKPGRDASQSFSAELIAIMKSRLEDRENATNIRLVGTGYSMDTFIYGYFQTVRGFDDPVSVRQDRPDVTNVRGGVGVFGAVVPDSLNKPYVSILIEK